MFRYTEVKDPARLLSVMEEYLTDYNTQSKTPMKLVLFQYAAQHVCRISRVIRQPFGNALLVGVGGSGRQSLTKLAAAMAGFHLFQVRALYVLFSSIQYAEIV
jgi:dynein heavy chain